MANTTVPFSIEIFKGDSTTQVSGCLNNAYGVEITEIPATLNRLISEIEVGELLNGLQIDIQPEQLR